MLFASAQRIRDDLGGCRSGRSSTQSWPTRALAFNAPHGFRTEAPGAGAGPPHADAEGPRHAGRPASLGCHAGLQRGRDDRETSGAYCGPVRTQLIVVDDCSTDGTRDTLTGLQRELGFTFCCSRQPRQGRGAARRVRGPFRGDIVVIQDADLEYSPEDSRTRSRICDGRGTSSTGPGLSGGTACSCLRTTWATVAHASHERPVQHHAHGHGDLYKVMRTDVLRSMTLRSNGFGIEPELTAKIFKRGYRVYEIRITYDGRGYDEGRRSDGATVSSPWVLLRYRLPIERLLRLIAYALPIADGWPPRWSP